MPEEKKSKKEIIEKLHDIIDSKSGSLKNLNSEEKKTMKNLKDRLKKKNATYNKTSFSVSENEKTLEPKVTVYPRGKQKVEISKIKTRLEISKTEITIDDEDIFEVEKIKKDEPEFLEVKPKKEETAEQKIKTSQEITEWEQVEPDEKVIKPEIKEKELPKWETVEKEKTALEKIKEEKCYCHECGKKIESDDKFCEFCGANQIGIEKETITDLQEVEIKEKPSEDLEEWGEPEIVDIKTKAEPDFEKRKEQTIKKEETTWEPIETEETLEKPKTEEIKPEKQTETGKKQDIKIQDNFCSECGENIGENEKFCSNCGNRIITGKTELVETEEKIETVEVEPIEEIQEEEIKDIKEEKVTDEEKNKIFEDLKSVDKKTAIILYDQGFTSADLLKDITYNNLKKIKGIKRKTAKEIIKELDTKLQEDVDIKPIDLGQTAQGEVKEEETIEEDTDLEQEDESEWIQIKETDETKIEEIKPSYEEIKKEEGKEEKINAFNEFESINDEISIILYDNGYKNSEELKKAEYKDLSKIKGITRKTAKNIIRELEEKTEWETIDELSEPTFNKEKDEEKEIISHPKEEKIEENKIEDLKKIKSIDQKTAILLYKKGYKNIDMIRTTSTIRLSRIKGLNRKKAKEIKKEIKNIYKKNIKDNSEDEEEFSSYLIDEDKDDAKKIDKKIKDHVLAEEIPEEEFFIEEEKEEVKEPKDKIEKKRVFEEINSVDEKIEGLLLKKGVDSVEKLKDMTIKDMTSIKGVRRKTAKKIKKEINKIPKTKEEETDEEWESYEEKKKEGSDKTKYEHKGYKLFEKEVVTKNKTKRKIRFFSKKKPDNAKSITLPKGYIVKENKKTGVPYLKKKK